MRIAETRRMFWLFEEWQLEQQEAWLADMASQGWHLQRIGMMVTFQKGTPREMRYRCEVANPEYQDDERKEIYRAAGWEHMGHHGSIQVYRAPLDAAIPEIHTEPITQALTFRHLLCKLCVGLGLLVVPLALAVLLGKQQSNLWLDLLLQADYVLPLATICLIYALGLNTLGIVHLLRLRRRLQRGRGLDHQVPYRQARARGKASFVAVGLMLLLLVGNRVGGLVSAATTSGFPPIPSGELPLVRLTDVLDETGVDWERSNLDQYLQERAGGDVFNFFRVEGSWLVPEQTELWERLEVVNDDNVNPENDLSLESYFYRTRTPGLARLLAEQLVHIRPFLGYPRTADDPQIPLLVVDEAAYRLWRYDHEGFCEFILQRGDQVYRVIYQGKVAAAELLQRTMTKAGL